MLNNLNVIIIFSLMMLLVLPFSFAADNVSSDDFTISIIDDDVLRDTNNYYFNASAAADGNGSIDSPYKFLTDERITDNSVLHLSDGEYEFTHSSKYYTNITVYGESAQTIIKGSGNKLEVNSYFKLENITFVNTQILNKGNLIALNTYFTNSTAYSADSYGNSYGGAIYSPNNNVYLDNCTFVNTYAEYGGAIYISGGILDIKNSNFISTVAYNYGGAIAALNTKNISISKSRFNKLVSLNDAGGAIYIFSSALTAEDIMFTDCNASFGGAIASLKSNLILEGITAVNNTANWYGGAIYHMYGGVCLSNSTFSKNNARNGAALFIDNSTSLTVINNNFTQNNASICAGAVYSLFNTLKYSLEENNQFKDNFAFMYDDVYDSSTLNLTVGNGNYTMYKYNSTVGDVLPSYYSLIDEGQVTVAKNQQFGASCWSFAGIAVLESCILKASGDTLDLSEENMKNMMAMYSDYGWDMETNEGGYLNMIYGYLASWLGPVNDSDDIYDDKSSLSQLMNSIAHVQNILFLKRSNYTDNDAIKIALMKYGAVGTSMYMGGSISRDYSFYYSGSNNANHAVTIVGWDDNYSKNRFTNTPEGDGAWIVKNSWGSNWGKNGYFYVSYYDTVFAQPNRDEILFTVILNDTIKFDKNYQYDIAGKTDYFVNSFNTVWYKNIFNATDDEYLAAVSTYFDKTYNYTVSVSVNGQLKLEQSGISDAGYYTINLNRMIPLNIGDTFEVMFELSCEGEAYFPISEAVSLNKQTYLPGISYVSYNGGQNWFDLYNLSWKYSTHWYTSQVSCIKAFTYLNEIKTFIELNVNMDSFNMANITAKVTDEYGNLLNQGNVIFTINGMNYNLNVSDGIALMEYVFNETENTLSALFTAEGFLTSYSNETQIKIPKKKLGLDFNVTRTLNNVTISFINPQNADVNLTLYVNDDCYTVNSYDSLNLTYLSNDVYNIKIALSDLSVYEMNETGTTFVVDVKNTQIISGDLIFSDDDFVDFNVTLTDEDGVVLSNKSLIFVFGDVSVNVTTDLNGKASIPLHLEVGEYLLETFFNGDNDYFGSSHTSFIKVKTNVWIDLGVSRYANNVSIAVNLSKMLNDNVTVVVNSRSYSVKDVLYLSDLDNGLYNVSVYLNDDYLFNEVMDQFVVDVKNTQIISGDLIFSDDDFVDFNVTLTDEDGVVLSNKSLIFVFGDVSVNVTTDLHGKASIPLHLEAGEYLLETFFNGDNDYFKSTTAVVAKVKTNLSIDLNIDKYANNVSLIFNISKKVTDIATVKINDKFYTVNITNGSAELYLSELENGIYYVSVFLDEEKYIFNDLEDEFTVDVKQSMSSSYDIVVAEGNPLNLNVTLTDLNGNPIANELLAVTVNGNTYNLQTNSYGNAVKGLTLNPGQYDVSIAFGGSDKYFKSSAASNIKVKSNVTLTLICEITQNNVKLSVISSKPINDTIILKINDNLSYISINGNFSQIILSNLFNGIYCVGVDLVNDNNDYEFNSLLDNFKIDVNQTEIISDNFTTYYKSNAEYVITLADINGNVCANQTIIVKLSNNTYQTVTDSNGQAFINLNLPTGEYPIEITYLGDNNHFNVSAIRNIIVKTSIILTDSLTKTYNSQYGVKFCDENANSLVNSKVSFVLNEMEYVGFTDENGYAYFTVTQSPGKYLLNITNMNNSEQISQIIEIVSRIAQNKDMTIYAFSGKYYKIRILDDNGNPVGANEKVVIKIAGKTYTVKTDKYGYAALKISLINKKYTITATYKGFKVSNKITVKPVIITSNKVYKKAKSYKFQAKLVNGNGKALKNKKITFKIKGKKYTAKTNKNGIAKITIKLSLKVGSYKIYSIYGKSKITNTIKIKK